MLPLRDLWKGTTGLVNHLQLAPAAGVGIGIQRTKERTYVQTAGGKVSRSKCWFLSTKVSSAEFKRVLQLEACHAESGSYLEFCVLPWISLIVYTVKNLQ